MGSRQLHFYQELRRSIHHNPKNNEMVCFPSADSVLRFSVSHCPSHHLFGLVYFSFRPHYLMFSCLLTFWCSYSCSWLQLPSSASFLLGKLIHPRMSSQLCLWSPSATPNPTRWKHRLWSSLLGFKSWLYLLLTAWLWVNDFTSLCLSYQIYKMELIIVSTSWYCCED